MNREQRRKAARNVSSLGARTRALDAFDNSADTALATYSLELLLSINTENKLVFGIALYKTAGSTVEELSLFDPQRLETTSLAQLRAEADQASGLSGPQEVRDTLREATQTFLSCETFYDGEQGKNAEWALRRLLQKHASLKGTCNLAIKAPKLQAEIRRPHAAVVRSAGEPLTLFADYPKILKLLKLGFEYDPWSKSIRRGRINAEMAKR